MPTAESQHEFQDISQFESVLENDFQLLNFARQGLDWTTFNLIIANSPFSIQEWVAMVHLHDEGKKENHQHLFVIGRKGTGKSSLLPQIYSERMLKIAQLLQRGEKLFGSSNSFKQWLDTENKTLGDIKPRTLLDSAFGIDIIHDELTRIEHGLLA